MNLEIARTIILALGWPALVAGSIFMASMALNFYRGVKKVPIGKLVFWMTISQIVTMVALGIVATELLMVNIEVGILVVLPVFIVWALILISMSVVSVRLGREGIQLNRLSENLEQLVLKRTEDLRKSNETLIDHRKNMEIHTKELEKFNRITVERELKMIELKKEILQLKERLTIKP